jgi:spore coat polysaccharide biosynthesis protein SpsF (cytidylyltransferase family)
VITAAVIQARMGSTRFPGKVLADLEGRPVLAHVIDRVARARSVDRVVVATTVDPADDEVAALAQRCGTMVTRGPEDDVLTRFVMAADQCNADIIVRVTADCPLTDPDVIDAVVRARAQQRADYASNVDPPTFPDGYDVEVLTAACLARLDGEATLAHEREHVTARIRERGDLFTTTNVAYHRDVSQLRLTVDVPADLDRVAAVLAALPADPQPGIAAVLAVVETSGALGRLDGLPGRDERYRAQRDAALRQETPG